MSLKARHGASQTGRIVFRSAGASGGREGDPLSATFRVGYDPTTVKHTRTCAPTARTTCTIEPLRFPGHMKHFVVTLLVRPSGVALLCGDRPIPLGEQSHAGDWRCYHWVASNRTPPTTLPAIFPHRESANLAPTCSLFVIAAMSCGVHRLCRKAEERNKNQPSYSVAMFNSLFKVGGCVFIQIGIINF